MKAIQEFEMEWTPKGFEEQTLYLEDVLKQIKMFTIMQIDIIKKLKININDYSEEAVNKRFVYQANVQDVIFDMMCIDHEMYLLNAHRQFKNDRDFT